MNPILLTELKAIMAVLESLPRAPIPAPVLPIRIDVPDSDFPYRDEDLSDWLEHGWELTKAWVGTECGPGTPLYEYYMENHLYPKLLEAACHYLSELRNRDNEIVQLALDERLLRLEWIYNIVLGIPGPEDIGVDQICDRFAPHVAEKILNCIYGFVEALFNYDLLNARYIAFEYGERLRLYFHTEHGWKITKLGQTLRNLFNAEAAAFLLIVETMRAMLDQDEWFVSRQRLQWLLEECPIRFDIYARDEEGQFEEGLKKDDSWLRRLRWLDIVTYAHGYGPHGGDIVNFNSRTIEFTPSGRAVAESILASWNDEPGKPSVLAFLDSVQSLGLAPAAGEALLEEVRSLREMIAALHIQVSTLKAEFTKAQRSFAQQLADLTDEAQKDRVYQEAYEELHQLVVHSLDQVDDRIREYDSRLADHLGATWGQLEAQSRHFLSSAEYLYSENQGAKALDFGPAAIEYCKVIEFELKERLVDSLADRLDRPWISLGQLAHLLQDSQNSKNYPQVVNFVSKRYAQDVQEFILHELPPVLKRITKKYRNGAAHTERLSQPAVEEFRTLLLDGESEGIPSLLQRIVQIQPVQ